MGGSSAQAAQEQPVNEGPGSRLLRFPRTAYSTPIPSRFNHKIQCHCPRTPRALPRAGDHRSSASRHPPEEVAISLEDMGMDVTVTGITQMIFPLGERAFATASHPDPAEPVMDVNRSV